MSQTEFNWDRPEPYIHRLQVDRSAIDSYQHVNNAMYIRWLDDCARAHSFALGIDCDQAVEFGLGMAVRDIRATYLAAAFEGDEILVGTWIVHSDRKLRLTREFQILRAADGKTLVRAEIDYVCININTGRPAKMPNEFKELYKPCEI